MHSTHSTNLLFGAGLVLRRGRFVFVCMCFFLIAMLVGCSTPIKEEGDAPDGPDYVKWIPKTFNGPVNESLPRPKEHWWKDFGSTELDGLVDTALTNNYELRVAVARVAQTRAQANIVRAAQSPTVDLTAGYKNQAPGQGVGYAATTDDWGSQPVWQAGLAVNYELDLWGKKGFNSQAAYSLALASEFNREAVALSLISDVVTVYFQVMALTERIAVGERNLDTIRMVGRNLQRRLDRGDSTLIDVSQQLVLESNTDAQLTNLRLQRERAINRLALLIGTTPSALRLTGGLVEDVKTPIVQPGLPSDLLCRRPDIRRAEAALESAQADLYAARANLLPSFALSAQGGFGSFLLSSILAPQSLFYNLSANLVQNVFDGGKRKSEVELANAKNRELLEAYANTVLSAMRDVEDGLSGVALTARQYAALNNARQRARKLAEYSVTVVERGGMDFVQLFQVQGTVIAAEDAAINGRFEQIRASVDLYKAIGGGLRLGEDPCLGGGKLPEADARWRASAEKSNVK
ncbi:TolC family protein [Zwartia sp. IMCC34845]|nr:TolC family protein [Zwartia vadi]